MVSRGIRGHVGSERLTDVYDARVVREPSFGKSNRDDPANSVDGDWWEYHTSCQNE